MPLFLIAAVLGSAVLHAGWNTLIKKEDDKLTGSLLVLAGAMAWGIFCILLLPAPKPASYPCMIASGVIHVAYFTLVAAAYRTAHLSVAYPVMRGTTPLIATIVAAFTLGMWPSVFGLFAILLLSGSVLWLAYDGIRAEGIDWRSLAFALVNAAVIASYTVIDGIGGKLSGSILSYNGWRDAVSIALFAPVVFFLRGGGAFRTVARKWKSALAGGAAAFFAYSIAIWAMTKAPIPLVVALRETSVVFGVVMGSLVLGERFGRRRYIAVAFVLAGLVMIRLS